MNGTSEMVIAGCEPLHSRDEKSSLRTRFECVAVPQLHSLFSTALYLTKNRDDAEDLVQETFARAYRFFDTFEPETNCRAWLLSVMRNFFYTHYRKKLTEPHMVEWDRVDEVYESLIDHCQDTHRSNPAAYLVSRSMDDAIARALIDLPEEFRTAVVLVDMEELTYEEAGKVMKVPIGTVRSRVSRGRRLLQAALKDYATQQGIIR
jgi:RNA polymerase sigma-70 factor, ECF subfamily